MKRLILILLACLLPVMAQAQDTIPADSTEGLCIMVFAPVPEFPGGQKALFEYVSNNVHYPKSLYDTNITGRVICQFSIQPDGTITDIEVVRSLGYPEFDKEAIRVISEMPKWVWNRDPGEYAPMRYTLPIDFKHPAPDKTWHMTSDTVSLTGLIDINLQPCFDLFSPSESEDSLYFSVNVNTLLQHYGYQMGVDYHFCISPDKQISQTSPKNNTPREGFIPLTRTPKWQINYFDIGEWGNYLSLTESDSEHVFFQSDNLRALFIQDTAILTVSQSTIARIPNPASGQLMTRTKTGNLKQDIYLYCENGASKQNVLWRTNALQIEWGKADTIIRGAFMADDRLMLAMSIRGKTGIYTFDGKDFQLEYNLGSLSLQDDYSTLQYQQTNPNSLLFVFEDAKHRQGILHIHGRSIHLTYLLFPDRPLPVSPKDPTIPIIKTMVDISGLTMSQVDSIEQSHGGVPMDDYQYYTLLSDGSYLWRTYTYDKSTGIVKDVVIQRNVLSRTDLGGRDWPKWQKAFVAAFAEELSPVKSENSNFLAYNSKRFHVWVSRYSHDEILIFFHHNIP